MGAWPRWSELKQGAVEYITTGARGRSVFTSEEVRRKKREEALGTQQPLKEHSAMTSFLPKRLSSQVAPDNSQQCHRLGTNL